MRSKFLAQLIALCATLVTAKPLFSEVLFGVCVRLLVTLPFSWFVCACSFAAVRCGDVATARCLGFALGAPIGLVVHLGLVAEEPPQFPNAVDVWLVAFGIAIGWATIALSLKYRQEKKSRS